MVTLRAKHLLEDYKLLLEHDREGITNWPLAKKKAIEGLIRKLEALNADEQIGVEAVGSTASTKVMHMSTGAVLGEVPH
jgi:hypothetical protein